MALRTVSSHHISRRLFSRPCLRPSLLATRSKDYCLVQRCNSGNVRSLATAAAKPNKKEASDYFLDNLGTIFLCSIGAIILSLVRTSYGTSNKEKIRNDIEEKASLDPMEIDDLRIANSELDSVVFRRIVQELKQDFASGTATYLEFVKSVRNTMASLKGPAFTIELGHLIDRAVVAAMDQLEKSQDEEMPLSFWLTILSLALHSSSNDRIRVLYEALQLEDGSVSIKHVQEIISWLQVSSQLTPDSQVVTSERKYPTQQYHRGTFRELLVWEGTENDPIDLEAFADILRSKAVCAWGECYLRKKPVLEENTDATNVNN